MNLTNPQSQLRDEIATCFNEEEIVGLCFDLDIEYEDLPGTTRINKIMGLIDYCRRHGLSGKLVQHCEKLRPNGNWQFTEDAFSPSGTSLSGLDYQPQVRAVEKSLHLLFEKCQAENRDARLSEVFPILRNLFNRHTYSEPFELCEDENWHDRFIGAIHTNYLLDQYWFQIQSAASKEQNLLLFESYEKIQGLLRNYSQAMTGLFQPSPLVSDVKDALTAGKTADLREQLSQDRLLVKNAPRPLSKEVIEKVTQVKSNCETVRNNIESELGNWPKI